MKFTSEQSQRYARHFVMPEIGIIGQQKLCESKVLVIGAGGLGSNVIMHLAAAGVGTIGIADFDKVELGNLQRQVIHTVASIGTNKADSASKFVEKLNPDVEVVTIEERLVAANIVDIMSGYDFVLDCVDRFETKFLINDACVLSGRAFCHGGVIGFSGQVMTYVPGKPCLRCVLGDIPRDAPTCAEIGVVSAAVGVIGSIQALETIKFLTGAGEPLVGRVFSFDGLRSETRILKLNVDPDCPVCGDRGVIKTLDEQEYKTKGVCNGR